MIKRTNSLLVNDEARKEADIARLYRVCPNNNVGDLAIVRRSARGRSVVSDHPESEGRLFRETRFRLPRPLVQESVKFSAKLGDFAVDILSVIKTTFVCSNFKFTAGTRRF